MLNVVAVQTGNYYGCDQIQEQHDCSIVLC